MVREEKRPGSAPGPRRRGEGGDARTAGQSERCGEDEGAARFDELIGGGGSRGPFTGPRLISTSVEIPLLPPPPLLARFGESRESEKPNLSLFLSLSLNRNIRLSDVGLVSKGCDYLFPTCPSPREHGDSGGAPPRVRLRRISGNKRKSRMKVYVSS